MKNSSIEHVKAVDIISTKLNHARALAYVASNADLEGHFNQRLQDYFNILNELILDIQKNFDMLIQSY